LGFKNWQTQLLGGRIIVQQQQKKLLRAEILFQIPKNYSLESVQNSAIFLDAFRLSFLTKSAATAAIFTSLIVDFGRPPLSSSTSFFPSLNREYHLKTFDRFRV
jgi:hypothetical protein